MWVQQKDIIVSGAASRLGVVRSLFSASLHSDPGYTEARLWAWRTRGEPGAHGANKCAVKSVL